MPHFAPRHRDPWKRLVEKTFRRILDPRLLSCAVTPALSGPMNNKSIHYCSQATEPQRKSVAMW